MNEPDFKDYDLIESYLEGHLSPEERTAFEEKLRTDPAMMEQLQLYRQLVEGIKHAVTREELKEKFRELRKKDPAKKNDPENPHDS